MNQKIKRDKKLKSRCCQSGCEDCPWGFRSDPSTPAELLTAVGSNCDDQKSLELLAEKYLKENQLD